MQVAVSRKKPTIYMPVGEKVASVFKVLYVVSNIR